MSKKQRKNISPFWKNKRKMSVQIYTQKPAAKENLQSTCKHPTLRFGTPSLISLGSKESHQIIGHADCFIVCEECKKNVGFNQTGVGPVITEEVTADFILPGIFDFGCEKKPVPIKKIEEMKQ